MLFSKRRVYLKKAALADFRGICSGDILVFDVKNDKLDLRLLPFIVSNEKLFDYAIETSSGSLSPRTKWKDLAKYELLLPPKDEQKRIANILWASEETIRKKEILIERMEQLNRELINEFLSKGMPGWHTEFKQTLSGDIPNSWRLTTVGQTATRKSQTIVPKDENILKYIGLEHIEQGTGKVISIESAQGIKSSKTIFSKRDCLYGKLRPYLDKVALVDFDGVCSTDILVLAGKEELLDTNFLFYILRIRNFISYAINNSRGTRMPRVSWKQIKKFYFGLPTLEEQRLIVKELNSTDLRIQSLKSELRAQKQIKTGLMSQLLC